MSSDESAFRVWDAGVAGERERWEAAWQGWGAREAFAHPAYAALFAREGDRVCCAAMGGASGGILFPLIVRPVPGAAALCDLVSPYGYGGPFAWGDVSPDAFWRGLEEWAGRAGAVSLFTRLPLFRHQTIPFAGEVEYKGPNVVRSLDLDMDRMWMDYAHKVRKNVKKAERAGLRAEVDPAGERLDEFLEIYHDTMQRRGAARGYYFPEAFFRSILREMPGQFAFFHVLSGERVVSTELVLDSAEHVYSFLGGTREEAFDLRPNDLLKHEVIRWARERGKRAFVLGGGVEPADGIFRYKLAFAPDGEVPFHVGKRVFDPGTYARLTDARRSAEREGGRSWEPDPGYFPAYRAP